MKMMKLTASAAMALMTSACFAKSVYLDVNSTNPVAPYSSWDTAASTLEDALNAATDGGDEIKIASGVYSIDKSLETKGYGTIIRSADKQTDAVLDPSAVVLDGSAVSSGSMLVMSGKGGPTLNSVTLRNARGAEQGGAVFVPDWAGAMKILNCRFENNAATHNGGAIYIHVGCTGSILSNCVFACNEVTENTGNYQGGGCIYSLAENVTVVDCVATNNACRGNEACGGVLSSAYSVSVKGGYFKDNKTVSTSGPSRGGVFWLQRGGLIADITVEGEMNTVYGGVVHVHQSEPSVVSNCVFKNLSGSVNYGLVHPHNGAEVVDCKVINSLVGSTLCFAESCTVKSIRNCLVSNSNTQLFYGFCGGGTVDHCTFWGNSVSPLSSYGSGSSVLRNCLLDFSGTTQDSASGEHVYVISNSYLTAEITGAITAGNVIGGRPGVKVDACGNCRLRADSPLLDKGLDLDWTSEGRDLDGLPRKRGSAPDLGCCERQGTESDFQRVVAREEDRVGEWAEAFVGVQSGVDGAAVGYDLLLKAGCYSLTSEITVKSRSLSILAESDGAATFDGQGKCRCLTVRTTAANQPVLIRGVNLINGHTADGDLETEYGRGAGVCAFSEHESSRIVLSHCLVSNCLTECTHAGAGRNRGGGVCTWGPVTLEDSVIVDCCASNSAGGGAYLEISEGVTLGGGPIARRCAFLRNSTFTTSGIGENGDGGGAYSAGPVWFEDCLFSENTSSTSGGGLYLGRGAWVVGSRVDGNGANMSGAVGYAGAGNVISNCVITGTKSGNCLFDYCTGPLVTHTVFSNNLTSCYLAVGPDQLFRNCLFVEPLTDFALFLNQGNGLCTVENCTFVNCKYAIYLWGYGGGNTRATVKNCLFANNFMDFFRDSGCGSNPSYAFSNCCFAANPGFAEYTATGTVLSSQPRFVDAANGNYRLRTGSPACNKGLMLDWMNSESLDLDGLPRVVLQGDPLSVNPNALPDIGCYECQQRSRGCVISLR